MDRERLWRTYCQKNPKFKDPDACITITGRGLRKFFDLTWEQAQQEIVDATQPTQEPIPDILSEFLNGGKHDGR